MIQISCTAAIVGSKLSVLHDRIGAVVQIPP